MKVEVLVVCDVNWVEDDLRSKQSKFDSDLGVPKENDHLVETRIQDSVSEAIMNSLLDSHADGFSHDMDDLISILPVRADAKIV
jgi:hypothetical protein